MSHLSRRGFTMVELLVSLVMMGIVATAIYRVLVNNQRIYQAQTQRIDLSQNIRAAGTILPGELREADANEGDIITMSSTSITFRAMRWMGYICNLAAGTCTGLPISPDGGAGLNMQVSAYMPQVADAATLTPAAPNLTNTIYAGAAIRGFVAVTYSLYKPAGDTSWYIGYQRGSGTMQPLIGPVLANGLEMAYYDSTGTWLDPATANNRALVERVDITVRGRTAQPVRRVSGGTVLGAIVDSVVVRTSLRNNRRF